jgi:hypothetical protein
MESRLGLLKLWLGLQLTAVTIPFMIDQPSLHLRFLLASENRQIHYLETLPGKTLRKHRTMAIGGITLEA